MPTLENKYNMINIAHEYVNNLSFLFNFKLRKANAILKVGMHASGVARNCRLLGHKLISESLEILSALQIFHIQVFLSLCMSD